MTAELGIFNKSCVVLAADSAVSYRGGDGLIPRNTATKLFALSDFQPVGIMIFGNPTYRGIPLELAIKGFRRKQKDKALDLLSDYQAAFVEHLREYDTHGETEDKWWMQVMANLLWEVEDAARATGTALTEAFVLDELHRIEAAILLEPELDLAPPEHGSEYAQRLRAVAEQALSFFMSSVAGYRAPLTDALSRAALQAIRREEFFNPTGLVIAGYGESEIFPGCVSFYLEGECGGRPRVGRRETFQVTHEVPSNVIPFAQGDVSLTVLKGIDPWFLRMIVEEAAAMMEAYHDQLVDASGAADPASLREALDAMGTAALEGLTSKIHAYQLEHHVKPTLGAIDLLSKEDLIEVAEALISLTTIKKRVSQQAEDVGGPVDIAVITKEDGFVWIKRKHYFSPKINPEYNARISSTFR